jgi:hypothetical protein
VRGLTPDNSDRSIEPALRIQHEFAELAHRAATARGTRDVVYAASHRLGRARHARGKSAAEQNRKIRVVVPDESAPLRSDAGSGAQRLEGGQLLLESLVHVVDAELPRPTRYGRRVSSRQDRELYAALAQHSEAMAVEDVERLEFLSGGRDVERPVGQDAVDIEGHQAHVARPSGSSELLHEG